jgi:hypothetical protein
VEPEPDDPLVSVEDDELLLGAVPLRPLVPDSVVLPYVEAVPEGPVPLDEPEPIVLSVEVPVEPPLKADPLRVLDDPDPLTSDELEPVLPDPLSPDDDAPEPLVPAEEEPDPVIPEELLPEPLVPLEPEP